ncbi:hypothetical protein [Streptomyces bottropensis]|uniref:hypothetical protein n=1 Tax=Streptomyces bottropensis TaxID=42235 RepID=UPI00367BA880
MSRTRARVIRDQVNAAAVLLGLLALLVLAAAAVIGAVRSAPDRAPRPVVTVAVGDDQDDGTVTADLRGDDNRDGRVDEDESGWDCRTMGNRVCGPAVCSSAGRIVAVRSRR